MTETSQLFHGVISGNRRRSHDEVADRADRIASGLRKLGVGQGDSVCILMRNDIAFIEAAYAVALLAESVEQMKLMGSPNQQEAVRANLEKRAPRFAEA